jgi:hypothetical protein
MPKTALTKRLHPTSDRQHIKIGILRPRCSLYPEGCEHRRIVFSFSVNRTCEPDAAWESVDAVNYASCGLDGEWVTVSLLFALPYGKHSAYIEQIANIAAY